MSVAVVATSSTSASQGVSVVPITQYSSEGMMNSTDFSVWVMMPTSWTAGIRSRGTTRCTPLERSEEHTSELQSRGHLVCRLLLEKKADQRYRRNGRGHT